MEEHLPDENDLELCKLEGARPEDVELFALVRGIRFREALLSGEYWEVAPGQRRFVYAQTAHDAWKVARRGIAGPSFPGSKVKARKTKRFADLPKESKSKARSVLESYGMKLKQSKAKK